MGDGSSSKECVLFADDSRTARAAARKVLQKKYTVLDAENGDVAWATLEDNADIELVIADINMPDSNGFELLRKIRESEDERIAKLPVVVITGTENSAAAMTAALKLGATDFISKPFKGVDLLCRVGSYITLNKKIRALESELKGKDEVNRFQLAEYESYARKYFSFARRHKSGCAFSYIDIGVLSDIHSKHSKDVLEKIQNVIGERIDKRLREEDLFSQVSINCFAVVMPATSQFKAKILLQRLMDVINAMSLEIAGESYRLSAKSSLYVYDGFMNKVTYEDVCYDLGEALDQCKSAKIATCSGPEGLKVERKEVAITDSLLHLFNGDYHKIIEAHFKELTDKLTPFLQYADSRCTEKSVVKQSD